MTTSSGHNSQSRAQTIQECVREITKLEAQRRSIAEKIREIKQSRIKGELDMKIGDFNAALRLYQLEGEDRDQFFDALRETFAALGIGGQLDWLDTNLSESESVDLEAVYAAGKNAGLAGRDLETNPRDAGTEAHETWAAGWRNGQDDLAVRQFNADAVAAS